MDIGPILLEDEPISYYPSYVDPERGKRLLEKWSKMLDYSDTTSQPLSARLTTAIILESEERWTPYGLEQLEKYKEHDTFDNHRWLKELEKINDKELIGRYPADLRWELAVDDSIKSE
jgi:hypothetical protein